MKRVFFLLTIALIGVLGVQAQPGGGFQRRTPEENLKQLKEKLTDLKLDQDQTTKSDTAFIEYFRARDKAFQEMRAAGGPPDREKMKASNDKLMGERDDKLKKIFTDDQFKKWKNDIEPSLRPQRGGGGPGGPGGNGGGGGNQ